MSNSPESAPPPPEPLAELEPDEPVSSPTEPEPVARREATESPAELGTPVGQMVLGAVLVAAVAVWVLYRLGGWPWVLIGLAVLVALVLLVVLAPLVWRRWRKSSGSGGRTSASRGGRSASSAFRWPGGRSPSAAAAGSRGRGGVRSALGQLGAGRRSPRRDGSAGPGRAAAAAAGKPRGLMARVRRGAAVLGNAVRRSSGRSGGSGSSGGAARRPGRVQRAWAATRNAAAAIRRGDRRLTTGTRDAVLRALGGLRNRSRRVGQRGRTWLGQLLQRARAWDQRVTGGLAAAVWSRWRKHRGGSAASSENTTDSSTTDPAAAAVEQPSPASSRPSPISTHWANRPADTGGTTMSDFAIITHATELPTIAATYESEDMMDVRGHMTMLRELPLAAGTTVRIWCERLAADYPLNQEPAEALQRVYEAFGAAVQACDEAAVIFEGSHEHDIQKRLQPRTNEHKWNNRSH